jgi:hypothetical protein
MTASATFDVDVVGAGHPALIAARYRAEDSGSVCLRDRRPIPAKPHTAPFESFMDDPQDFKKRSTTGSPYENPDPDDTSWVCGRTRGVSGWPGWLAKPMPHADAALPQPIQLTQQCRRHIETRSGHEY